MFSLQSTLLGNMHIFNGVSPKKVIKVEPTEEEKEQLLIEDHKRMKHMEKLKRLKDELEAKKQVESAKTKHKKMIKTLNSDYEKSKKLEIAVAYVDGLLECMS